jgi:hypothetical protein
MDEKVNNILNELAEEYKELLIKNIIEEKNYTNFESIDIRDIINADNQIKQNMINGRVRRRDQRFYSLITLTGASYGILGLWVYFYNAFGVSLNGPQNIGLGIAMIGFSIAVIGYLLKDLCLIFIKKNYRVLRPNLYNNFEIVEKWNEIEKLAYKITNSDSQDSEYLPLHKVLDKLRKSDLLSENDKIKIKDILESRNASVHHSDKEISYNRLQENINNAKEIIEKLNKISND